MLRASHRVLRPGGRIAFYAISVAPHLSDRDRRRGTQAGPPCVATSSTYPKLLLSARFTDVVEVDLTSAYLDTARAWLRYEQQYADELATLDPPGVFADELAHRRTAIAAIEAGLLRRSLLLGTRPPRRLS